MWLMDLKNIINEFYNNNKKKHNKWMFGFFCKFFRRIFFSFLISDELVFKVV